MDSLPPIVSYFLGHRTKPQARTRPSITTVRAFLGVFSSLLLISAVSYHIPAFQNADPPVIVGSFGAAAVLEFYATSSPFAQPRNTIGSQILGSIIGVGVCKLFALGPDTIELKWVAGALACALTVVAMAVTETVHPPAGATAIIAVVDAPSRRLGWYYVPMVLLGTCLMFVSALLVSNILGRFPEYWWSPTTSEAREGQLGDLESGMGKDAARVETRKGSDMSHITLTGDSFLTRDTCVGVPNQAHIR